MKAMMSNVLSFRRPDVHPRVALVVLAMLIAALTVACVSPGRPAALGEPLVLRPGDEVTLPDATRLRYLGISADSRCPPQVQCIRAGDADVAIEYTAPGARAHSITINTESPAAEVGTWRLRLLGLEFGSSPRATLQADPARP